MEKFHTEPHEWSDIFEFLDYMKADNAVTSLLQSLQGQQ